MRRNVVEGAKMTYKMELSNGQAYEYNNAQQIIDRFEMAEDLLGFVMYDESGFEVLTAFDLSQATIPGRRVLVWESEEISKDDDGSRAYAEITYKE